MWNSRLFIQLQYAFVFSWLDEQDARGVGSSLVGRGSVASAVPTAGRPARSATSPRAPALRTCEETRRGLARSRCAYNALESAHYSYVARSCLSPSLPLVVGLHSSISMLCYPFALDAFHYVRFKSIFNYTHYASTVHIMQVKLTYIYVISTTFSRKVTCAERFARCSLDSAY